MNGGAYAYAELFWLALPEMWVALTVLVVLAVDGWARRQPDERRRTLSASLTALGCFGGCIWLWWHPVAGNLSEGMWIVDPLSQLLKEVFLLLTGMTALISLESRFTRHCAEFCALLLLGTIGLMVLVSTADVLLLFVGLELASLSLYLLTAFDETRPAAVEAGLKYFLYGSVAAAVLLFGLSLLYGLTGETHLGRMAVGLSGLTRDPLFAVAMAMTLAGLGFKVAAAPFHLWAPDAYQAAPTPAAALIASGSKVAGFVVLARVLLTGFAGAEGSGAWRSLAPGWVPLVAGMSVLSLALGNLAALAQTRVKRLLAYSAIAHTGYVLVGLTAANAQGLAAILFYVTTYALTMVGAFGVVAVVEAQMGTDDLSAWAGLNRRAPDLAACSLVFLLSLAGIPPLAGFFGKFYLFIAAAGAGGLGWLVGFALAMSVVGLYYYLIVLKQVYVAEPPADAAPLAVRSSTRLVLAVLAVAVVVLGAAPALWLDRLRSALRAAGW